MHIPWNLLLFLCDSPKKYFNLLEDKTRWHIRLSMYHVLEKRVIRYIFKSTSSLKIIYNSADANTKAALENVFPMFILLDSNLPPLESLTDSGSAFIKTRLNNEKATDEDETMAWDLKTLLNDLKQALKIEDSSLIVSSTYECISAYAENVFLINHRMNQMNF
jgi:hypothetical protein